MLLIKAFEHLWKNLSDFREDQKLLLKLLQVTAGIINKEKLFEYQYKCQRDGSFLMLNTARRIHVNHEVADEEA
jgi:hypothetical protein